MARVDVVAQSKVNDGLQLDKIKTAAAAVLVLHFAK